MIDPKSNPLAIGWNEVATERIRRTLEFLDAQRGHLSDEVLDIGGESPLGQAIVERFRIRTVNTNQDLDVEWLTGRYRTVFSFEVIEHLGSPLRHLQNIFELLEDQGSLFLSTPLVVNRLRPTHLLRGKHHIFEMDRFQLDFLIQKAGFRIASEASCRYLPTWKYFIGLRPFIKYFTDRCILLRLEKSG